MKDRNIGPLTLGALWFAASVSMAEMATGGLLAGMGFARGIAATIAGHAAGAGLFFWAGWMSWKRTRKAMAVCEDGFGRAGPVLFGSLNFVQLVGWTAVMILAGARNLDRILPLGLGGDIPWRAVLGALILLWAVLGPGRVGKANTVAAIALATLCAALSAVVFGPVASGASVAVAPTGGAAGGLSFGSGFELAIIMPLSWLPLVGDYLCGARNGRKALIASAGAYTVGSVWMYALGMGAVIVFGTVDPVSLLAGRWSLAALAIVLLSTVTTAFLDALSAGVSLNAAFPKIPERVAVAVSTVLGAGLALVVGVERYESFLLFVGSVFAPLYAVMFADASLSREKNAALGPSPARGHAAAFVCWALGLAAYHLSASNPSIVGTTLPVMALVGGLYTLYVVGARLCASSRR